MVGSMWYMSIVTLLVVDVRTGALQQKEGAARRCYFCPHNGTCDEAGVATTVECSGARSHCATVAVAPNFTSSLNCGAPAKSPCSLTYNSDKVLELVCACTENLCNAPYSKKLQILLHTFVNSNFTKNNSSDYTDDFFNSSNITGLNMFKAIEIPSTTMLSVNSTQDTLSVDTNAIDMQTTLAPHDLPRAEALKHETTEPSDDEEDVEGSGADEDSRYYRQPPPSAPAAPSSYLPAKENKASPLFADFFITTSIILYIVA